MKKNDMTRPNMLFIQTDQLTALALASYGNRVCQTPHLDQLAAQGVVFERAYCNYPLCSPFAGHKFAKRAARVNIGVAG